MIPLNLKIFKSVNEVFKRLNKLRRWTSFVTEGEYDELSKQALNCIIAYMLIAYCEEKGQTVKIERIPKIALYRAFQKAYVNFDVPEYIIDEILQIGDIDKNEFDKATAELIKAETAENFTEFICEGINTYEMRIYQAATKIATLIELVENRFRMNDSGNYDAKMREITKYLDNFSDIPGVEELQDIKGNIFKVLQQISQLRNQNRWAVQCYTIDCAVLGHLFDTAVLAYFIGLEKYESESIATKMFFMGCFHDVAEAWTKDIPSSIKDRISGFREATEKYELMMVEKKMYANMQTFLSGKVKSVMFEENENLKFKKLMKGADYLSADSEIWRIYKSGSRDEYFIGAVHRFHEKLEKGTAELTPTAMELHMYFMKYIDDLNLPE